jgi:hypothetical protein
MYGANTVKPETVYAEKQVEVVVEADAPILAKIAKCESGNKHYDKNGQVLMRSNKNGSIDIGKYQINEKSWGKAASKLGFNLTDEKDNEAMAKYIYANRGTEDWYASKSCWMK